MEQIFTVLDLLQKKPDKQEFCRTESIQHLLVLLLEMRPVTCQVQLSGLELTEQHQKGVTHSGTSSQRRLHDRIVPPGLQDRTLWILTLAREIFLIHTFTLLYAFLFSHKGSEFSCKKNPILEHLLRRSVSQKLMGSLSDSTHCLIHSAPTYFMMSKQPKK